MPAHYYFPLTPKCFYDIFGANKYIKLHDYNASLIVILYLVSLISQQGSTTVPITAEFSVDPNYILKEVYDGA